MNDVMASESTGGGRLVAFFAHGDPVPQARPRMNRTTGRVYTPSRTRDWQLAIAIAASDANAGAQLVGPIRVSIDFHMRAAKSRRRRAPAWSSVRPDLDNLIKAVLDGCTEAVIWDDDAQVAEIRARKIEVVDSVGVAVTIEEMRDEP